jgi:glycosyltransferase involved in cell wall biosynthesis
MAGLVGPREVSAALDRAIALVDTSDYEGFPNSFLEAWAHGVPIVTIHADPDELICGKDLGIHTRTSEALVAALRRLADHPGQAFEMGRRAREYCMKHHNLADVISRWRPPSARAIRVRRTATRRRKRLAHACPR